MNQIRHKNTILRALPSPVMSTHLHSTRRKQTATQAVANPKWTRSSRTAAVRLATTSDLFLQRLQNTLTLPSPDQQQITSTTTPSSSSSPPLSMEAITLISLATAVAFICSLDRSAMSVAILPMSETFQWDDTIKGSISAAFFGGYMITNVLGGYLATRFSAKHTLAVGVAIWSIFTLSTPIAALSSSAAATLGDSPDITALLAARGAMGLGEGVAYPAIQTMIRAWVPSSSRSRALSFIYSGHQIGTIGSYVAAPVIISQWGWPVVFYAFGSLGFVWLMAWLPAVSDGTPESLMIERGSGGGGNSERRSLGRRLTAVMEKITGNNTNNSSSSSSDEQQAAANSTTAISTPSIKFTDIPWAEFAQSKAFWAIVAAQVSVGVGNCLSFSWLPTYYSQQFGVDVTTSSAYTIIPFLVTAMATNASGWIADGLVNNGVMCRSSTRKLMQGVASIGPAVCLMKLAADGESQHLDVNDAVVAITAWLALCGFSAAGYGSNHADISKKWAGVIFGLSNGLASIAGSASIYATGRVLNATHDWGLIFEGAAACYLLGAGVYMVWASSEEQFDK